MYKIDRCEVKELFSKMNNLDIAFKILGNPTDEYFENVSAIDKADEFSLVFVGLDSPNQLMLIQNSRSKVIICPERKGLEEIKEKVLIIVDNPKYVYAQLVNHFLGGEQLFGSHPTTIIHPEANIHINSYIGPNTYIGRANIGEGTQVSGNCFIFDNVTIGKRVLVAPGCVIGSKGFGFVRDKEGIPIRFPQIGGVIIEDDVEIGANTCIDRGALDNTIIREGVKIDNLVHIAHNVEIGKYSFIISNSVIAGSSKIGEYCWISPSSTVINKVKIGDRSTVGIGSVVTKSIPCEQIWLGNPAEPIEKYINRQKKLKTL